MFVYCQFLCMPLSTNIIVCVFLSLAMYVCLLYCLFLSIPVLVCFASHLGIIYFFACTDSNQFFACFVSFYFDLLWSLSFCIFVTCPLLKVFVL